MKTRQIAGIVLAVVVGIVIIFGIHGSYYHQDANEIAVVQSPFEGILSSSFQPGTHWLGWGKVTMYPRRGQIEFDEPGNHNENVYQIQPLDIRFNDGANSTLYGAISWEMPVTEDQVIKLHKEYGSTAAIEQQLLKKTLEKSVFVTGPLMSSAESYAARRNDLLAFVSDQVEHGAYRTQSHDATTVDPLTGQTKSVRVVEIMKDDKGNIQREDQSPVSEFGIHTFSLAFRQILYPTNVEAQIQNQQSSIMAVQTAIANAKTAEQDALTIEQQGKAAAAKTKWEQEAIKAKEVTIAQKNLEVAALNAQADQTNAIIGSMKQVQQAELAAKAAAATKAANILLGEGEAQRAQLNMQANGALEQKLAAWKEVNKYYADAMKGYTGAWVPQTVMGASSSGGSGGNAATDLISLFTAKTARDISLDMSTAGSVPKATAK